MNRNIRIGLFTAAGIALIIGFSFYVNDRPDWNSRCKEVKIYTDDATGLRRKSAVKTLGLDIGFIKKVTLDGTQVLITVCVTAPIEILPETKPYIRSQGFLGDKFLELKPVDMIGAKHRSHHEPEPADVVPPSPNPTTDTTVVPKEGRRAIIEAVPKEISEMMEEQRKHEKRAAKLRILNEAMEFLIPSAHAEDTAVPVIGKQTDVEETRPMTASRETEMQDMLKKVGKLVDKLTLVMDDIRSVTQQKEFKDTIVNLNAAMKNMEQLLRPNGKLVKNVNDSLDSLKNTMEQAEEVMKKINHGEGTIGKFINDPSIFDEMKAAINSINLLLGRAGTLRTFVDMSGTSVRAYNGYQARFSVKIAPNPSRYYLLGLANDPRGRIRRKKTETSVNSGTVSTVDETVIEEKGLKVTALFGKYFGPLDLHAGLLEDNGAIGIGYWLDPARKFGILADFFSPDKGEPFTARIYGRAQIFMSVYLTGGVDQLSKYNGKRPYFGGVGLFFDDDDLKYLLAFK